MQTKNVTFEQIYDLYAVRIIFNPDAASNESERDQCYHIFSIITGIYRYKPDRVRDWVKHPKNNGYEALHCTLMNDSGIWIEVQIRTKRMDDIAEKGIAAHWAYKKDGYTGENDSEMDKWLSKVKEILMSPDINALELLDIIHNDLVSGEIMVFTPKGEQKSIQKGATVLDFAYQIHTEIGNKAIAAKVNMKLVPLSYILRTGDQVEIITAEDEKPKKEWLGFLKTRHAKNLVIDYFRPEKKAMALSGRKMLQEKFKESGISVNDKLRSFILENLELTNVQELYFRYYLGIIQFDDLLEIAGKLKAISELDKYVIAKCCNPIAGDSVLGFRSPEGVITVHKKSCSVAQSLATKHGDWIVTPVWKNTNNQSFLVRISIKGIDRMGLLNDITKEISLVMEVNMRRIDLGTEGEIFDGHIDLLVQDKNVLEDLINKLSNINGIQSVMRTDI